MVPLTVIQRCYGDQWHKTAEVVVEEKHVSFVAWQYITFQLVRGMRQVLEYASCWDGGPSQAEEAETISKKSSG